MSEQVVAPRYCYANLAVATPEGHLQGFYVVRVWVEDPSRLEPISFHDSVEETEEFSIALNAEVGITSEEATKLLRSCLNGTTLDDIEQHD